MSSLLISEPPLVVLPSLAKEIGLNEALVLQQIHFWIGQSPLEHEGFKWMYRTDQAWLQEFCFWSDATIRRAVKSLKKLGLIRVEKLSSVFGGNSFDRKNYYTINYYAVSALALNPTNSASGHIDQMEAATLQKVSDNASGQNDQMEIGKVADASSQNDQIRSSQIDQIRYGQNDQMLKENNKRDIREVDSDVVIESDAQPEPATTTTEELHPVFQNSIPAPATQSLSSQQRFPMFADWQPSKHFSDLCFRSGINAEDPIAKNAVGNFVAYYMSTPGRQENQARWDSLLISWITREKAKAESREHTHGQHNSVSTGDAAGKASAAQAITEATRDLGDSAWAGPEYNRFD